MYFKPKNLLSLNNILKILSLEYKHNTLYAIFCHLGNKTNRRQGQVFLLLQNASLLPHILVCHF